MLRVARVTDRTGRYYLEDLASELDLGSGLDLGSELDRAPRVADGRSGRSVGRWLGSGAAGLGLSGPVDAGPLAAVLAGRHPSGGHPLRVRETPVRAYDLTFAAPKSASVVFALGPADAAAAVRGAHDDAVVAATAYVAAHAAAMRRTGPSGRTTSPVDGLVAASFTHGLSRALDPHVHSHVVVANLARGDDGRWRAIDGRGLYAHARAAGALYDAVLRHGVTARLGLEWSSRRSSGWELAAVDPVLVGALSGRRAEILADLDSYTRRAAAGAVGAGAPGAPGADGGGDRVSPSRRARALAWAVTRDPKVPRPSPVELRARWAAIARDVGCSVELEAEVPSRRATRADLDEHRFQAAIYETGRHGVTRRDALGAWAGALGSGAPSPDISRCVDALRDWGPGTGVAEGVCAPGAVVPPPHTLRTLGPRPASPERLSVWLSAASSIARYRERWEVRDPSRTLGAASREELAAMPPRRLADHLSTRRAVDEALSALGRGRDRERRLGAARGLVRGGL